MTGMQRIKVYTKNVSYDFTLNRKITIIRGDSATGKTTLFNLINDSKSEAIHLECKSNCMTVNESNWEVIIKNVTDTIIFIDEGFKPLKTREFAKVVNESGNFFVIITRNEIPTLTYSVHEIYEIKSSGKFYRLIPLYPDEVEKSYPDKLVIEDSKSGYTFFLEMCCNNENLCTTAMGNSKVAAVLEKECCIGREILVIVDGAAFGAYLEKILNLRPYLNFKLFMPESFEYLLLSSNMFRNNKEVQAILKNISDYVPQNCISWERFFANTMVKQTEMMEAHYKKDELNRCYCEDCCCKNTPCNLRTNGNKFDIILGRYYDKLNFSKVRP